MFYLFNKKKEVMFTTLRDEWGRLQTVMLRPSSRLTDKELAEQLGTSQATVERERKD